ncbi:MAG: bifunctional demethylmenaquinone methyltransferase/2-methoxy-6-polyprenyl-1,4-benzoquinol methylase, partial [Proteobacteria bacterium]|nr:bifunctional demethylmenaquinone methyltransferase/2-methoxy-6-polyprenyl-1,4-benzoquinol methylase [Pseudomonadota bacterium]
EMHRVLKPGGKVVICEFSQVSTPIFSNLYGFYLKRILPRLSSLLAKNKGAYDYLAESILAWPNQKELLNWLSAAGFVSAKYRNLNLGIVAIHSARKAEK